MRDHVTTALDVLGLLLVAVGVAATAALWVGRGPAVGVAGVVVLAGSWWWGRPPKGRRDAAK